MTKPDGEFLRSLTESQGSVQVAADWLRSLGYEVRVTPLRVRPDASQITAYQDDGDLSVCIAGNWEIVEVKEIVFAPLRELARDPSRTIIIDNAASFERNNPHGYVLIDRAGTIGVVKTSGRQAWKWSTEYIGPDRQTKTVIRVPMSEVRLWR
jgi:hypothetical protein